MTNVCNCFSDYVVVGSDSGRIVILEYIPSRNTFEKVHKKDVVNEVHLFILCIVMDSQINSNSTKLNLNLRHFFSIGNTFTCTKYCVWRIVRVWFKKMLNALMTCTLSSENFCASVMHSSTCTLSYMQKSLSSSLNFIILIFRFIKRHLGKVDVDALFLASI